MMIYEIGYSMREIGYSMRAQLYWLPIQCIDFTWQNLYLCPYKHMDVLQAGAESFAYSVTYQSYPVAAKTVAVWARGGEVK